MKPTRLETVLRKPANMVIALLTAIVLIAVYVYTQVLTNLHNVDVWVANVPPVHAGLLLVFAGLFGVTFTYQLHLWRSPKICSVKKQVKGTSTSGVGTIALFLVAQCPACASLGALFLPVSVLSVIAEYTVPLNLLSIALLVFTLHYLGAFARE